MSDTTTMVCKPTGDFTLVKSECVNCILDGLASTITDTTPYAAATDTYPKQLPLDTRDGGSSFRSTANMFAILFRSDIYIAKLKDNNNYNNGNYNSKTMCYRSIFTSFYSKHICFSIMDSSGDKE